MILPTPCRLYTLHTKDWVVAGAPKWVPAPTKTQLCGHRGSPSSNVGRFGRALPSNGKTIAPPCRANGANTMSTRGVVGWPRVCGPCTVTAHMRSADVWQSSQSGVASADASATGRHPQPSEPTLLPIYPPTRWYSMGLHCTVSAH